MTRINRIYHTTSEAASIDSNGHNFYCIYGTHINGNYISIQNWGVNAELSEATDVFYNKGAISEALTKASFSKEIADVIAKDIATAIVSRLQTLEEYNQQERAEQESTKAPSQNNYYRGR